MTSLLLAVDQGTTGTTVLAVDPDGIIRGRGYQEHPQHFPAPGQVEHDAEAIWRTVLECTDEAMQQAGALPSDVAGVGITNQRETIVAWDCVTGDSIGPTIVWQDRRTSKRCAQLRDEGWGEHVRATAGLPIDPYFSATKIEWLLQNDDDVKQAAEAGTLRLGTIDSYLIHRMSGGTMHATDASNAARTMLFDIHAGQWDTKLCELFSVDPAWLPQIVDSVGEIAACDPTAYNGLSAPVCGVAGDQQSALFGQACFTEGQAKATYGTGAFVLVNSGDSAPTTEALISTIGWQIAGKKSYALEGSIFTAGASVQWLRDGLQIIDSAPEIEQLAASVPDTGGVVVVPAFAGMGAPFWDADARAAIMGMTRGTTRAHIARATLESITFRVRQVIESMRSEGTDVNELRVDGGMCANDLFLQLQADVLQIPVTRPTNIETTSMGAAFLAGLGCGVYPDLAAVAKTWNAERTFEPSRNDYIEGAFARYEQAAAFSRSLGSAPAPIHQPA